jgi:hypothetical protein
MSACNAATQSQHWQFSIPVKAPFLRIQNRLNSSFDGSTRCLSPTNNTAMSTGTCSNSATGEDWLFFP